jgi:uncharacterized protein YdbL (DUF1318 family)
VNRRRIYISLLSFFVGLFVWCSAHAQQADLEINTPAIAAIKNAMQARHAALEAHYASGAIGLTRDGFVAVRDANTVPLSQRQAVNGAVSAENDDRRKLYQEIARANNHPEWADQVQSTFAQRWIQKAQPGWWYQDPSGAWKKK